MWEQLSRQLVQILVKNNGNTPLGLVSRGQTAFYMSSCTCSIHLYKFRKSNQIRCTMIPTSVHNGTKNHQDGTPNRFQIDPISIMMCPWVVSGCRSRPKCSQNLFPPIYRCSWLTFFVKMEVPRVVFSTAWNLKITKKSYL